MPEFCTGLAASCPPDQAAPAGQSCRAAASGNDCDAVEVCDGTSVSCPADAPRPDGSKCSTGTCQAGLCRAESDLSITITASPSPIQAVTPISFVVQVENRGPAPADGVSVALTVPDGTTIQSLGGDGWTCQVQLPSVTCTRPGPVPFGNAPPLVMVVVPSSYSDTTSVVVTGTATSTTPDPSSDNNAATTTVTSGLHPRLAGGGLSVGCNMAPAQTHAGSAPLAPCLGLGLAVLALALRRRRVA